MPRHPTWPDCFDEVKKITITDLRQMGYLATSAIVRGPMNWTRNGKPSGSIAITVSILYGYVELDYKYGDKPIKYRVELESLPKHFGGREWYFICPATRKRCRTLYGVGELFLSRFAYPSAMYSSQTESKRWRGLSKAMGLLALERDYLNKRHSRTMYRGNLTKRYLRILGKQARFDPNTIRRLLGRL